jgi:hypothetical protein
MAATLLKPVGTLVWPLSPAPQITTAPSFFERDVEIHFNPP